MKRLLIILLIAFFAISGCGKKIDKPLELTTNLWTGFVPLIYAKETGMLDGLNIRLNVLSSLGESTKMFDSGLIDGFTGTQKEWMSARNMRNAVPVILIDRSFGADAVVSSMSEEQLDKARNVRLDVFYETGTINDILLSYLRQKKYMRINGNKILFHSYNQDEIWNYDMKGMNVIIVSYEPYLSRFLKRGFHSLINSKDNGIFIYDALFVKKSSLEGYGDDIVLLHKAMKRSIKVLNEHPREFYNRIHSYLQGQSYEEFIRSLGMIRWIDMSGDRNAIINDMNKVGMDTGELLRD